MARRLPEERYRKALDVALKLNAPQDYYTQRVGLCYAQLGQMRRRARRCGTCSR